MQWAGVGWWQALSPIYALLLCWKPGATPSHTLPAHGLLEGLLIEPVSKERQQQCPVLLWGGDVAAGIQEGFLEVAAMGLLPESDLGGWKRKVFQAEGTA